MKWGEVKYMDCEFCGLGSAIGAEHGIKAWARVLPDGLSIELDDGDHSYDFGFAIKHCPMCGKKPGGDES